MTVQPVLTETLPALPEGMRWYLEKSPHPYVRVYLQRKEIRKPWYSSKSREVWVNVKDHAGLPYGSAWDIRTGYGDPSLRWPYSKGLASIGQYILRKYEKEVGGEVQLPAVIEGVTRV
jgi:hypothetical protein